MSVWRSPEGDGLAIHFFDRPPDLPKGRKTKASFIIGYERLARSAGAQIVEIDVCLLSGHRAVWVIVKTPQEPSGMTYVASFTIPFRKCSWVIKAQCEEWGTTGMREAVLLDERLRDGSVKVPLAPSSFLDGDWNPDDSRYDERFPDHPVSRARRNAGRIREQVRIDPEVSKLKPFQMPHPGEAI